MPRATPPPTAATARAPAWRVALAPQNPGSAGGGSADADTRPAGRGERPPTPLALQFELREATRRSQGRWQHASTVTVAATPGTTAGLFVAVRPVIRSPSGRWVSANVGWGSLQYQRNRLNLDERQVRWFGQFQAVSRAVQGVYLGQDPDRLLLDEYSSRLLWHLLDEAHGLGIALVSNKNDGSIVIGGEAAVSVDARSAGAQGERSDLQLRTVVSFDGAPAATTAVGTIGDHGLYTVEWTPGPKLTLAPSAAALTDEQRRMLKNPLVTVPADDVAEFLGEYYPVLRQSVRIASGDGSVRFPRILPPVLVLVARYEPGGVLQLDWEWEYRSGENVARKPLAAYPGEGGYRDARAEELTLARTGTALAESAEGGVPVPPIAPATITLRELDAAEFTVHVLPIIAALPQVRVDRVGDKPDYRELTGTPKLTVKTVETDQRDWFDLGVLVEVDGKNVPFGPLFTALSKGETKLKLIDNSYLSLKQPVFDRLRELIQEGQDLAEWETGPRINRYQASLWADFEDLADESEPAQSWRAAVGGLLELTSGDAVPVSQHPLPAGVNATLRPYQNDGYAWLAFLWRHGLGGILADDMGLGKTLQTLVLIAQAREQEADRRGPFLVVAPTSVVSNWVSEAAHFTPGLSTVAITTTQAKARTPLAGMWTGADIVVTSYTLFRLDFAAYQAQGWAGLILDEAQFVKNHASRAHECARDLDAPFKLAVTGTPMENNLMELWSLLQIVAPGLFPSSRRFTEEYVRPLQRADSYDTTALLAKLRRRIRPLMMRRTKELVAPELPPKQEQVLQIELTPKHRKLYDSFLQRERQKLLGLLEDLDRNRFIVFRSLTLLRMLSLDASLIDEAYATIPSSKLDVLFEQLDDVLAEGHRVLIFSQFTSFLQKAAARLDAQGVEYVYLDGSTRGRAAVIARFKDGAAPVFLISLKAGGFGLNLTEADYVFLLDPWWNPASEAQAVDRTHRIGQDRNVMVYRMVATGTIEEKVMALKAQKSRLFDAVLDDDAVFSSALTADDIRGLLDA